MALCPISDIKPLQYIYFEILKGGWGGWDFDPSTSFDLSHLKRPLLEFQKHYYGTIKFFLRGVFRDSIVFFFVQFCFGLAQSFRCMWMIHILNFFSGWTIYVSFTSWFLVNISTAGFLHYTMIIMFGIYYSNQDSLLNTYIPSIAYRAS